MREKSALIRDFEVQMHGKRRDKRSDRNPTKVIDNKKWLNKISICIHLRGVDKFVPNMVSPKHTEIKSDKIPTVHIFIDSSMACNVPSPALDFWDCLRLPLELTEALSQFSIIFPPTIDVFCFHLRATLKSDIKVQNDSTHSYSIKTSVNHFFFNGNGSISSPESDTKQAYRETFHHHNAQ